MSRSVEHGHTAVVHADRDAGAEVDDLGGRALRDELDAVEEDAVEDVVAAELAGHDLAGSREARLELEELRADEYLGVGSAPAPLAGNAPIAVSIRPATMRPDSTFAAPTNSAAQRVAGAK